jgi:hypothetical protein
MVPVHYEAVEHLHLIAAVNNTLTQTRPFPFRSAAVSASYLYIPLMNPVVVIIFLSPSVCGPQTEIREEDSSCKSLKINFINAN